MKTQVASQKCLALILVTILIAFGTQSASYGQEENPPTLNVGEPRTVRLIYLLPNGRPYRQEVVDAMKTGILEVQSFYAEQMQAHGFGNKTFRIETDDQGDPKVHRVDGGNIGQMFDFGVNVYLIVNDSPITSASGSASRVGKNGGLATIFDGWNWFAASHELGHAFGLHHDFRDNTYILSYGRRNRSSAQLSACAAEFLAVHPYFNSEIPIEEGSPPTIELISSPEYAAGSNSVTVRLKVSDSEGLHQVLLFGRTSFLLHAAYGGTELITCRGLTGETDTIVEFDYDGVVPSSVSANLPIPVVHPIDVAAVDMAGNVSEVSFVLAEVPPQHIATLGEHTATVLSVSFSPDGTTLASGSGDGTVKLWNTSTRDYIATLEGHRNIVNSVSFSPDGTTLASGSYDGKVKLWNVSTKENIATLSGHWSVGSVAFSPDGTTLASGGGRAVNRPDDSKVILWDVATRTNIATLEGHRSAINSVAFSPDGTTLASLGSSYKLNLWDVATRTNIATIENMGSRSVSFSPDGMTLASPGAYISDPTVIKLWDVAAREQIATLENQWTNSGEIGHTASVYSVSFSPDGTILASAAQDKTVQLWNVATREHIAIFSGHTATVTSVAFSPDGTMLASVSGDNKVKLWDTSEWAGTPVVNHAPTGAVTISGTAAVGETLTADASTVMDPDGPETLQFSYQWLASDVMIAGATSRTYILTENETGKTIRVRASYIDGLGVPVNITSEATEVVSAPLASISDRTPQVRDAIVAAVPGVNSANDVTEAHLAAITYLALDNNKEIIALKAGDFDGLSSLITLSLHDNYNNLTGLPEGVFSGLSSLATLYLNNNNLTGLPEGVFSGLSSLTTLWLSANALTGLPEGVFSGLSSLATLYLNNNNLTGLPEGVFSGLSSLTTLWLYNNDLTSLPKGAFSSLSSLESLKLSYNQLTGLPKDVFSGMSSLTELDLSGNAVDPLPLTVSLEKVADGQFKAVAPTGAPFDIVVPIRARNGEISGGATTLTITAGSVESEVLSVTRTIGTSGEVSVWIGALPSLPANHTGYRLAKATGEFNRLIIFDDISEQIWSGTVTGGSWGNDFNNGNATGRGYSRHYNAGSISNPNFTYRGTTYTIHGISFSYIGNNLPHQFSLLISPSFPACDQQHLSLNGIQLSDAGLGGAYGASWYLWRQRSHTAWPVGHQRPWHITLHPTVPDAPIVTAINEGNQVMLSWETPCDGGKDITRHEYRQRTRDGAFGSWIPIPDSAAGGVNVASYTLTGVNNPQENIFEVRAVNELGEGAVSAPAAPSDRTPQVAEAILEAVKLNDPNVSSYADITDPHLAAITTLNVRLLGIITTLKADDFEGLTSLEELNLWGSRNLTGLPDGIFEGLTSLTRLQIYPLFDSKPITVSLEKVGTDQCKAVVPTGAPFEMVLPLALTNGRVSGGATTITIPAGSVESEVLTVTRTPDTTGAVTVNIRTLPSLPSNHGGYTLAKSADLPLSYALPEVRSLIGSRTPQVRDAIVAAVPGVNNAADVTEAHLAAITVLNLTNKGITALKSGDFDGLTALTTIRLWDNELTTLPADIFDGLTTLTALYLRDNELTTLPADIFDGLTTLTTLYLSNNAFTTLPADIFDGLTALDSLALYANAFTTLPADIFDGLTALDSLYLYANELTTLPTGIFDGLTALTTLHLGSNAFTTLPAGIFDRLTSLSELSLANNDLRSLPDGIFKGLNRLSSVSLGGNTVDPFPLTVSLEKVADGQFKAVAPTGTPFDIVLPISVTNGSITSGATTLTIPAGSVESQTLTVTTHTSGATFATSVNIGTLPSLPANHSGYTLVKSADLPLNVTEGDIADTFAFTMTVARINASWLGFHQAGPGSTRPPYGSLSRQTFNFKGITYTVHQLYYSTDSSTGRKNLNFQTGPLFPRGFELYLDSQQFNSAACNDFDGDLWFGRGTNRWYNVDLNWLPSQTVQVRVVETTPVPPGPPTNLQATTDFKNVTLTWDPHVNTDPTSLRVEKYELRISDDGGTTWDPDWEDIEDSGPSEENRSSVTIGGSYLNYSFSYGTEYTFEVRAKGGDGSGDAARITVTPSGVTPVRERTPLVRDAIVAAVPGVNSADDVTEAHLAAITSLRLSRFTNITTLKAGDFDGLTGLTTLDLSENQLSTLPEGIFDDLTALTTLELNDNQLSTLPADIFDALAKLRELHLYNNQITTLPASTFDGLSWLDQLFMQGNQLITLPLGIFDKLTGLRTLNLEDNQLSTLPAGIFNKLTELNYLTLADNRLTTLPESIFDGPSALYDLWLDGNQFSTLPVGIFKMEASFLTLRKLYLEDNAVDPLSLTVSLEKVADSQFKAVARAGAPFDFALQISVANGTITGGATNITISKGSVESDTLTVTRTAGTTDAVTVDISYPLPELPTNHQGYELVRSDDLPLEVISASAPQETAVNIPDANLRAKIETALGKTSGDPITATEMATLTSLNAQNARITNLTGLETATNLTILNLGNNSVSDISALVGLTNLTELHFWDNQLSNISALAGLTNLTKLYLWGNTLSDISHLSGLTNLRQLRVGENSISNISAVSRLTNLTYLSVKENNISNISAVAGLTNLTQLQIGNNSISDISAVQNLTKLVWLDMPNNSISDISAVQNLTQLVELYFQNNAVSDLSPLVANTGLGTDDELDVRGNLLSYPSIYTHIPALQTRNVYVDFDNRVPSAPVKISGDTQSGNTGTLLTQPFIVEVQDTSSVAFEGVPVTFAVAAGGGSLTVTNTTTNDNGRAESTLTLGNTAGTNTVRVSVTGITQITTFTATATTTNTAPVFTDGTSTTRAIAENTAAGINIGTPIAATDAENDTLTYTLSGTDVSEFDLHSTTGQLKTKAALDYETKASYTVTITVSDGSLTDTISVTINVIDVNDTVIVSVGVPVAARTSQVRDAIVAAIPGVSAPNQVTAAHLAAITSLDLRSAGITALQVDDFSGMTALTSLNLFNNQLSSLPPGIFEGLTSLTTIRLGQNAVDPLPLTVSLEKVGEGAFKAVAPAGATFNYVLPITVANGTINGGATTLIIPHGSMESGTLTVTRTAGTTGHVMVDIAAFPRLPRTHYGYALVKSDHLPLAVIRGINTAPVFSDGTTATRFVAENTTANTNIGTPITATDVDNDRLTYTLSGTDAAAFSINSTTGQLRTRAALDYETKAAYSVTVAVSDGYGGSDSMSVTINVTDIHENRAPVFTDGTTATRTVAENTAANTNIGTAIAATDADNDTLTYTLSGTDAAAFRIVRTTGQLRTRAAFVSDGSLTDTITVTLNITDINELPTPTAICRVGDILAPGESCTYPDTDAVFSVLDNGDSKWNIPNYPWLDKISADGSMSVTVTVNDENYHFVAKSVVDNSWEIEEIGDDTPQQPDTPEQPIDTTGTPTLSASTAALLTEATLHEGIVTLTLSGRKFARSIYDIRDAVSVSGITGVTVGEYYHIKRQSDTEVTVEITFDGNLTTDGTLTITVDADAIVGYNEAFTVQLPVTAVEETITASTEAPLTEATLNGSTVTLTLSGRIYAASDSIGSAVSVSGIPGVTIKPPETDCGFLGFFCSTTYYARRVSDTEVKVTLEFEGDIDTDGPLTFTVGADAIAGYNGPALTAQVSVSANPDEPVEPETPEQPEDIGVTPTLSFTTAAPLTEATLHEGIVTLTLNGGTYEQSSRRIRRCLFPALPGSLLIRPIPNASAIHKRLLNLSLMATSTQIAP